MKILKIKVGEVFIKDLNKSFPVFQTAFWKKSKDGKTVYYEVKEPIFIQEVTEKKEEVKVEKVLDL